MRSLNGRTHSLSAANFCAHLCCNAAGVLQVCCSRAACWLHAGCSCAASFSRFDGSSYNITNNQCSREVLQNVAAQSVFHSAIQIVMSCHCHSYVFIALSLTSAYLLGNRKASSAFTVRLVVRPPPACVFSPALNMAKGGVHGEKTRMINASTKKKNQQIRVHPRSIIRQVSEIGHPRRTSLIETNPKYQHLRDRNFTY